MVPGFESLKLKCCELKSSSLKPYRFEAFESCIGRAENETSSLRHPSRHDGKTGQNCSPRPCNVTDEIKTPNPN